MANGMTESFRLGLYMHFKGKVYCAMNVVKDCTRDLRMVQYFSVDNPEAGMFVRPLDDSSDGWFSENTGKGLIKDRPDNMTGQTRRFEPYTIGTGFEPDNYSTELLMNVLRGRDDCPLKELDIEGLESTSVVQRDWCIARIRHYGNFVPHVDGVIPFDSREDAVKHIHRYSSPNKSDRLYLMKRIFLVEKD